MAQLLVQPGERSCQRGRQHPKSRLLQRHPHPWLPGLRGPCHCHPGHDGRHRPMVLSIVDGSYGAGGQDGAGTAVRLRGGSGPGTAVGDPGDLETHSQNRGRGGRGGGRAQSSQGQGWGPGSKATWSPGPAEQQRPRRFQICPASGVQEGLVGLCDNLSGVPPAPGDDRNPQGGRAGRRLPPAPRSTAATPQPAPLMPHGTAEPHAGTPNQTTPPRPGRRGTPRAPRPPGQAPAAGLPVPPLPGSGPAHTWPWGSR